MELLESHGEELSNDDLMQMEQQRAVEQEDNENDDALPPRSLSTKKICLRILSIWIKLWQFSLKKTLK